MTARQENLRESFFTIGAGTAVGWQFVTDSAFTINICGGVERMRHIPFSKNKTKAYSATNFHLFGLPVDPFASISLGYSF